MKSKFKTILFFIVSLLILSFSQFFGKIIGKSIANQTEVLGNKIQFSCKDVLKEFKSKSLFSFPQRIDVATTAIDIRCENDNFVYIFKLNDFYDKNFKQQISWKNLINELGKDYLISEQTQVICKSIPTNKSVNEFVNFVLKMGSLLKYRYYLSDNSYLFEIYIDKNTCKSY